MSDLSEGHGFWWSPGSNELTAIMNNIFMLNMSILSGCHKQYEM